MAEHAPPAIRALFESIRAGIPGAVLSGIVGDQAHKYGYHRARNVLSSSDYSNQRADDKAGDGWAASALDVSLNPADMKTVTQRLISATQARDKRVQVLREFFGTVDGRNVTGLDVRDVRWVTSDASHLWHVHLSIYRRYATDHAALQQVAAVITAGGTTTQPPKPPADWFDMATQKDLEKAVWDTLNQGTAPGQQNWAGTNKAILGTVQALANTLNAVRGDLAAIKQKLGM